MWPKNVTPKQMGRLYWWMPTSSFLLFFIKWLFWTKSRVASWLSSDQPTSLAEHLPFLFELQIIQKLKKVGQCSFFFNFKLSFYKIFYRKIGNVMHTTALCVRAHFISCVRSLFIICVSLVFKQKHSAAIIQIRPTEIATRAHKIACTHTVF